MDLFAPMPSIDDANDSMQESESLVQLEQTFDYQLGLLESGDEAAGEIGEPAAALLKLITGYKQ